MEIDTHPATELSKQTFVFWDEILYILRLYIFSKILNNIETANRWIESRTWLQWNVTQL